VYFDEGWALIRPSGTEPIFRIYSEARSDQAAKRIGDECERALEDAVRVCRQD
jgi:phosphomannomutase/phosphoglucomutase